ncbi:MAG: CBS domain-containing protein [Steroidobacteraceae bacterium]
MSVEKCYRRAVITIAPQADLADAAALMRREHVGLLMVVNEKRCPVGVLTDRDIVIQTVLHDTSARAVTVGDAMTSKPVVAFAGESIDDITERMCCHGVRRLPVVDNSGALIGIIASDDVLDYLATQMENLAAITHKEQSTERRVRQ